MPAKTAAKPRKSASLAVEDVSRKPQQGRSKASLERMLAAARELMLERGNEDFTLQDVSQRGNVSIGSIYLRFESKDNLVRAVIADALDAISAEETTMLAALTPQCTSLGDFVPRYVESYAEVLRVNARCCASACSGPPVIRSSPAPARPTPCAPRARAPRP